MTDLRDEDLDALWWKHIDPHDPRKMLRAAIAADRKLNTVVPDPTLLLDGMNAQQFALRELHEFQEATGCDTAAEFKALRQGAYRSLLAAAPTYGTEGTKRHLTVTTNMQGDAVLVSWQDEEHRILETVWERSASEPMEDPEVPTVPVPEVTVWSGGPTPYPYVHLRLDDTPREYKYVLVAEETPANIPPIADVLDALTVFNRPAARDEPWRETDSIAVTALPAFIHNVGRAWYAAPPAPAVLPKPGTDPYAWQRKPLLFEYVSASKWPNGSLNVVTYHSQVQRGTAADAEEYRQYCETQTGRPHRIYKLVELDEVLTTKEGK